LKIIIATQPLRVAVTHPVGVIDRNVALWARATFYAGIMSAYYATWAQKYLG
jgi:hypothetical protein